MIMKKSYNANEKIPEKMQVIYESVCALIEEGRDGRTLTVSEITKRAGIGKGTAYEYFDNKEEMIDGAICYQICGLQSKIMKRLLEETTLRGRLGIIYDFYEDSSYDMLFYQAIKGKSTLLDDPEKMKAAIGSYAMQREQFSGEVIRTVMMAVKEMYPRQDETQGMYENLMISAIINLISEICFSRKNGGRWADMDKERVVDTCMAFLNKLM